MDMNFIFASIGVFLVMILLLVVILLVAKKYLSPSGNVKITINGDKSVSVAQGGSPLSTLAQKASICPLPVEEKVPADSVSVRFSKVEAKSSTRKRDSSPVNR